MIIETYAQLVWVLAVLVNIGLLGRYVWRNSRARQFARDNPLLMSQAVQISAISAEPQPRLGLRPLDFDRMATVIASASDRAAHISETQAAAATKIDSTEMAVHRLLAELAAIGTTSVRAPTQLAPILPAHAKALTPTLALARTVDRAA